MTTVFHSNPLKKGYNPADYSGGMRTERWLIHLLPLCRGFSRRPLSPFRRNTPLPSCSTWEISGGFLGEGSGRMGKGVVETGIQISLNTSGCIHLKSIPSVSRIFRMDEAEGVAFPVLHFETATWLTPQMSARFF